MKSASFLALLILLCSAVHAVSGAESYVQTAVFGGQGSGDGQLDFPEYLAVDDAGNVYVADDGNHRVAKFASNGAFLTTWGSDGLEDGQFSEPVGIAAGGGYVYVSDMGYFRVQKFTPNGTFLAKWGTEGFGDGQFWVAGAVAVDEAGRVYVSEARYQNPRVQVFDANGTFIASWITFAKDDRFGAPMGVAADGHGHIYVVDLRQNAVLKFTTDGTYITRWGTAGSGDGQFRDPMGIAVDGDSNVYVTDTGNCRVQKFGPNGTFLAKWGSEGTGVNQFSNPRGIGVDGEGSVFVTDTFNDRVQKFVKTDVAAIPGGVGFPHDLNGDGKYEDVDGSGGGGFTDLILYFSQMEWIAVNEPLVAFDYNQNGAIDFADIIWLFYNL